MDAMNYSSPEGSGRPTAPASQWQAPGSAPIRQRVRPGRRWYLLALAIFVAGVAFLVYGIVSLTSTISGLQRTPLPGSGVVSLTRSGGYTVYYEGPGATSGNIPAFHVNVTPASPGASVASLRHYSSVVHYDFGSHTGRVVLSLTVRGPGRFKITATGPATTGADVAVGGSIGSGIVGVLVPGIPLMILGFLGAIVLLIIRLVGSRSAGPQQYQGYQAG
jgi:hypothetical protein